MEKKRKTFGKSFIKNRAWKMHEGKKAQMHFPFQLIFSLVLIAVFLFVAFFVIRQFLDLQKCSQVGLFVQEFQKEVNDVWQVQEASTEIELDLDPSLSYVCFANLTDKANLAGLGRPERDDYAEIYDDLKVYFKYNQANMFLYPWQSACEMPAHMIDHISLDGMPNPYCLKNTDGKVKIKLVKGFDDLLVKIS